MLGWSWMALAAPQLPPPPAELAVDGDLAEWSGAPWTRLGPGQQVAGKIRASGPEDLSAEVWLAASTEGLWVAARVRDDAVLAPTAPTDLASDHLEIWLALPAGELSPLAFGNQFGFQELPDDASCDEIPEPDACRAWRAEQLRWRQRLERRGVRQFALGAGGAAEVYADGTKGLPTPVGVGQAQAVVREVADGYHLEGFVPVSAYGSTTAGGPWTSARVLIDLVDNDQGRSGQESFFSAVAGRAFGRPETFQEVELPLPVLTDPVSAAVWARQQAAGQGPVLRVPGQPTLWVLANVAEGYQYSPHRPSPEVIGLSSGSSTLAQTPAGALVQGAWGLDDLGWLAPGWFVVREGRVLGAAEVRGELQQELTRDGRWLGLAREVGLMSRLGTGQCGACPMHHWSLVEVDAEGKIQVTWEHFVGDGLYGGEPTARASLSPGGKELVLRGYGGGEEGTTLDLRWRWTGAAWEAVP